MSLLNNFTPDQTKVEAMQRHDAVRKAIDFPQSINRKLLSETTMYDWMGAVDAFKSELKGTIKQRNPNTTYGRYLNKEEKQQQDFEIAEYNRTKEAAEQTFSNKVSVVKATVAAERQVLLTEIKAKKYPAYSSKDSSQRVVGAAEMQIAANTPLKYINSTLLQNYAAAGRTDLVSALIEKAAMNSGELQGKNYSEVYQFAQSYYDSIGVNEDRTLYRQLKAVENHIMTPALNGANCDSMKLILAEGNAVSEINTDNLLEI